MIIPALFFLLYSTGIVVFQAHCNCTGTDEVSVYVAPETCADDFHVHHHHDNHGEEVPVSFHDCHSCQAHTEDCGCNAPEVRYFKLDDQIIRENVRLQSVKVVMTAVLASPVLYDRPETGPLTTSHADPPPLIRSGLDLLLHIQQLKIPSA